VQRELLERQPLSEAVCDALTRRLERLGRRAEALGEQEGFRARFVRELGVEPELEHRLTSSVPIAMPAPTPASGARPSLLEPPLVGREGLWQQLLEWFGQDSPGQALLLIGEGGVGKSRLAAAFTQFSSGAVPVPYLRASESGQGQPFGALSEALRRAGPARLAALEARWQSELAPLVPELFEGRPGRQGLDAPASEVRLLEALFQALRLALMQAPIAVLEDVHWLDASSVRALSHTEKRLRDDPAAPRLLATARPGELRRNAPLRGWLSDLEREGRLIRLEVSPLSEVSVLKLVRLLSGSPRATGFAKALHSLSNGNPYALLAFVQGLISRGHLETHGPEGWQLHLELSELRGQLPATLRGVLLQNLEAQGEAVLKLLEAAALRGQTFEFEAARAGSGLGERVAHAAFERILKHRWASALPDGHYRLEHDLLRQTLEGNPEPGRLGQIHRRLAAHLDAAGVQAGARAHHWEAAGERTRAFSLWKESAQEAGKLWAHREALNALEHALNCTDDPSEKIGLYRQRGRHWQALNLLTEWSAELEAADALLLERPVEGEGLKLALERTHLLLREGKGEEALTFSEAWTDGEINEDRGLLLHDRGATLLELGRPEEAVKVLRHALEGGVAVHSRLWANVHNTLAYAARVMNEVDTGLQHAAWALEGFQVLGRSEGIANAFITRASLLDLQGHTTEATHAVLNALQHAQDAGHANLTRYALDFLVDLMAESQDIASGLEYATQGLEFSEREGYNAGISHFSQQIERLRGLRVSGQPIATQL